MCGSVDSMNKNVSIYFSTQVDGSMLKAVSDAECDENRRKFLAKQGITPVQAALVYLQYEGDDYCRYRTIGQDEAGDGIATPPGFVSDALFTREKNLALLLPVADCVGVVVYDPTHQVLGLVHLGRHNLLQQGGTESIGYMQREFGTNPADVQAWLSPAAGRANYPLFDFEQRSMHEVATAQLKDAGIPSSNIEIDARDTTTDPVLFSHSEFLKGNRQIDGRQAVVAMMK